MAGLLKKVWLILAVALILRLWGVNQSLWLDEATSIRAAKLGYTQTINDFSRSDFHPPGYYWLAKTWGYVFGISEVGIRLLSVVAGVMVVFIVYKIAGQPAAWLTAVNPLLVYYSQEARMYSVATLLAVMLVWAEKNNKHGWLVMLSFISFWVYYPLAFFLAAMVMVAIIRKKIRVAGAVGVGFGLALIIVWPLLWRQQENAKNMLPLVTNWSAALGQVNLKNLALIPIKFSVGRISFYPKWVYYLLSALLATVVWTKAIVNGTKKKEIGGLFLLGFSIALLFSLFTPMMQYFRLLFLLPLLIILIGNSRLVFAGFLMCTLAYLGNSNYYREDWESLSKEAGSKVYMIESVTDPIKYYRPDIEVEDLKSKPAEKIITVIPYAAEIHGLDYVSNLIKEGYARIYEKSFRELKLEKWQKTR